MHTRFRTMAFFLMSAFMVLPGLAAAEVDVLAVAKKVAETYKDHVYPGTKWLEAQPADKRPKMIDCTQYVSAVVEKVLSEAKLEYDKDTKSRVMLSNFKPEELKQESMNKLVEAARKPDGKADERLAGVRFALTKIGKGDAVANLKDAKPGDLVQYWYKSGGNWFGHSSVIVSVTGDSAVLLGSHKTALESEKATKPDERKGGVGESVSIKLGDPEKLVYIVRFNGK